MLISSWKEENVRSMNGKDSWRAHGTVGGVRSPLCRKYAELADAGPPDGSFFVCRWKGAFRKDVFLMCGLHIFIYDV